MKAIDTTRLSNGVHTMAWVVTDNLGAGSGIGSRFFTVSNSGLSAAGAVTAAPAAAYMSSAVIDARRAVAGPASSLGDLQTSARAIAVSHGYPADAAGAVMIGPDAAGVRHVRTAQLERVLVDLDPGEETSVTYPGYTIDGDTLRGLPVGSHLDEQAGEFSWAPGLAFGGTHDLVFVRTSGAVAQRSAYQIRVRVTIDAQASSAGEPRLVIDTPGAGASAGQRFTVAGWAMDPSGPPNGSGVDTLHVWAYPIDEAARTSGPGPRWIGVAAYGGLRPDVAELFGPRFARSGYSVEVAALPAGTYDIVVYAHSIASNSFAIARTVRVTVR